MVQNSIIEVPIWEYTSSNVHHYNGTGIVHVLIVNNHHIFRGRHEYIPFVLPPPIRATHHICASRLFNHYSSCSGTTLPPLPNSLCARDNAARGWRAQQHRQWQSQLLLLLLPPMGCTTKERQLIATQPVASDGAAHIIRVHIFPSRVRARVNYNFTHSITRTSEANVLYTRCGISFIEHTLALSHVHKHAQANRICRRSEGTEKSLSSVYDNGTNIYYFYIVVGTNRYPHQSTHVVIFIGTDEKYIFFVDVMLETFHSPHRRAMAQLSVAVPKITLRILPQNTMIKGRKRKHNISHNTPSIRRTSDERSQARTRHHISCINRAEGGGLCRLDAVGCRVCDRVVSISAFSAFRGS